MAVTFIIRDVVKVLTQETIGEMLAAGGSREWKASRERVLKCKYLVAVNNARPGCSDKQAFMIGRISGASPVPGKNGWLVIHFDQYAELAIPGAWDGNRNPVAYTTLKDLGVDLDKLSWIDAPAPLNPPPVAATPLTIQDAKKGIAALLGITTDCIEITIKV